MVDALERQRADQRSGSRRALRSVLIIVQNLPVPFDRRVWLECQALRRGGYEVSVICPKGPGDPAEETIDGVTIYKYPLWAGGGGPLSFLVEYGISFAATAWLTAKAWRRRRFSVIQACNPPDIFWPIALVMRLVGVRFVFDHHDLCPELFGRVSPRVPTSWSACCCGWSGPPFVLPTTSSPPMSPTAPSRSSAAACPPSE